MLAGKLGHLIQVDEMGFVALASIRLGAFSIGAGIAQRFGQPARLGEETFGFGRHVALLQMRDEVGGPLAGAFAHGFEDARLGDAAEIVADRRAPAGFGHVELDRLRQTIRFGDALFDTMRRDTAAVAIGPLIERIDAERCAMGEEFGLFGAGQCGQPIPEISHLAPEPLAPAIVPGFDRLGIDAVAQPFGLRMEGRAAHADLHREGLRRGIREGEQGRRRLMGEA